MSDLCDEIERFGKGVGNACRYRIVEALSKGPKTVNDLVKIVKMSQPAVSQHLKTLKMSRIVSNKRKGQEVWYTLNTSHILKLLTNLSNEVGRKHKQQTLKSKH